jgi:hypothetical protein
VRIFENRVLGEYLEQGTYRIFESRLLGGYLRTGYLKDI